MLSGSTLSTQIPRTRREMDDTVDTLHRFFYSRDVADVSGDEIFRVLGFA